MNQNWRTWAMILHFSVLAGFIVPFAGLIAPIVIWQVKKNEMPEIDAHGMTVANFLLSMLIYAGIAFILSFVLIGILLFWILAVVFVAYPIVGGIKANSGELWSYPGILRLIK